MPSRELDAGAGPVSRTDSSETRVTTSTGHAGTLAQPSEVLPSDPLAVWPDSKVVCTTIVVRVCQ
ncbi:hypothetical protein C8259_16640 [Nocardia nova]|uniref:Uncharacterized protein n=1 Tax=Nocardia nova TaxID=37330 RepID=A0A2T2Z447_9NOCA|nr:hypothetical protein C8259_16640 [Nocardia nova]